MPELPEVETIRAFLDEHVRGKTITAIDLDLPRLIKNTTADRFQAALTGQTLEGVSRRGKYLFVHCSGPWSFLAHMRMTGSLLYEERPGQYAGRAIHITFTLSEGRLLYRDIRTLGCLWLVPSDGPTGVKGYDSLGPDAISPDFTADRLYALLKGCHRPVKTLLLDQTKVAGLGNIYVDEALFRAGIRPMRHSDSVTKKKRSASMKPSSPSSRRAWNTAERRSATSSAATAKKGRTRKTSASTAEKARPAPSVARLSNTPN